MIQGRNHAPSPTYLAALLLAASTASAAITIPTVSVGDVGNDPDPDTGNEYGDVAYNYRIGTHEVTNRQYTAFLNAVAKWDFHSLYSSHMGTNSDGGILQSGSFGNFSYSTKAGMADKPVNYISFWDAARFANWLTNGQPTGFTDSGTTEDGMYDLGGVTYPDNDTVTREIDFSEGENGVAVASEDEWYKAAYYDPTLNNGNGGYYKYPTQSDQAPQAESPPGGNNSANYDGAVGSMTEVGAYPNSGSYYGTFDQGGNVSEWNDEIIDSSSRGLRGGSFGHRRGFLQSSGFPNGLPMQLVRILLGLDSLPLQEPDNRSDLLPFIGPITSGFRVTSLAPINEPSP